MQEAYSVLGNVKDRKLYDAKNAHQQGEWQQTGFGKQTKYYGERVRQEQEFYEWVKKQRPHQGRNQQQTHYKWTYHYESPKSEKSKTKDQG